MSDEASRDRCNQNLVSASLELAQAFSGTTINATPDRIVCSGAMQHSLCNFAYPMTEHADLAQIAQSARSHLAFAIFLVPSPWQEDQLNWLLDDGFVETHRMCCMAAIPRSAPSETVVGMATDLNSRIRVANFMTGQFFSVASESVRHSLSACVAMNEHFELFSIERQNRTVASVGLYRTNGIAGLYSLCVEPPFRRQGIGSELVTWFVRVPACASDLVTLQCSPRLESFYHRLGFSTYGQTVGLKAA